MKISSLPKHRSTLKETSPEEDFAQAKLEDIKQKANKLEQVISFILPYIYVKYLFVQVSTGMFVVI